MNKLKKVSFMLFAFANVAVCFGRKYSHGAAEQEPSRVVKCYIGDHDYHKYGQLIMEQQGNKYHISVPFFQYLDTKMQSPEIEIVPKGTKLFVKLDDDEMIIAETEQDVHVLWHYWWHYACINSVKGRKGGSVSGTEHNNTRNEYNGGTVYKYHDKSEQPPFLNSNNHCDIYGLNWQIKFEFTNADMQLLSKHRIADAYIIKQDNKVTLPITSKQSLRIEHTALAFLK